MKTNIIMMALFFLIVPHSTNAAERDFKAAPEVTFVPFSVGNEPSDHSYALATRAINEPPQAIHLNGIQSGETAPMELPSVNCKDGEVLQGIINGKPVCVNFGTSALRSIYGQGAIIIGTVHGCPAGSTLAPIWSLIRGQSEDQRAWLQFCTVN